MSGWWAAPWLPALCAVVLVALLFVLPYEAALRLTGPVCRRVELALYRRRNRRETLRKEPS